MIKESLALILAPLTIGIVLAVFTASLATALLGPPDLIISLLMPGVATLGSIALALDLRDNFIIPNLPVWFHRIKFFSSLNTLEVLSKQIADSQEFNEQMVRKYVAVYTSVLTPNTNAVLTNTYFSWMELKYVTIASNNQDLEHEGVVSRINAQIQFFQYIFNNAILPHRDLVFNVIRHLGVDKEFVLRVYSKLSKLDADFIAYQNSKGVTFGVVDTLKVKECAIRIREHYSNIPNFLSLEDFSQAIQDLSLVSLTPSTETFCPFANGKIDTAAKREEASYIEARNLRRDGIAGAIIPSSGGVVR